MARTSTGWRSPDRRRLILLIVCATLVIVLAAYVYWPKSDTRVTVTKATIYIFDVVSGKTPTDWFGSPYINETSGYPFSSTRGAAFTVGVQLINFDRNATHIIVGANASSPFVFVGTSPSLPLFVGPEVAVLLNVTVDCPPTAGSYALNVTLNAI